MKCFPLFLINKEFITVLISRIALPFHIHALLTSCSCMYTKCSKYTYADCMYTRKIADFRFDFRTGKALLCSRKALYSDFRFSIGASSLFVVMVQPDKRLANKTKKCSALVWLDSRRVPGSPTDERADYNRIL